MLKNLPEGIYTYTHPNGKDVCIVQLEKANGNMRVIFVPGITGVKLADLPAGVTLAPATLSDIALYS